MSTELDPNLVTFCFYIKTDPRCKEVLEPTDPVTDGGTGTGTSPTDGGGIITDPTDPVIPAETGKIEVFTFESITQGFDILNAVSPMSGQLAYTFVALYGLTIIGLQILMRSQISGYYNNGTTVLGSTNYWQIANQVEQYGTIAFWGIATLTQLLSDVGVMTDINMMVWMYGEIFACLAIVAATGLRLFAYWTAHGVVTTVGSPNASTAETLKGALEYEMLHTMALNGFAGSILNGQKDNWLQAQWNGLS